MEQIGGDPMSGQPCKDCATHQDMAERLVVVEQSTKSAHHRMDGLEKHTESIIKLTLSVETLSHAIAEQVLPNQQEHHRRLTDVESRPGRVALRYLGVLFAAVIVAVVSYTFGAIV